MHSSALGVDHQSALHTALTPDRACAGSAAKRCTQDPAKRRTSWPAPPPGRPEAEPALLATPTAATPAAGDDEPAATPAASHLGAHVGHGPGHGLCHVLAVLHQG